MLTRLTANTSRSIHERHHPPIHRIIVVRIGQLVLFI